MNKMNKKEVLNTLKEAKRLYAEAVPITVGMCFFVKHAILSYIPNIALYEELREYIPELNAEFLGGNSDCVYWWPVEDGQSRLKAFDKLIAIYEEDNNVC